MLLDWFTQKTTRLDLWPRMAVAISLGFISLFVAFSFLSERALQDSINTILEERLAITQLVADQIDTLLANAIIELQQANVFVTVDENGAINLPDMEILAQNYGRIGLFADGIVLINKAGRVVGSYPPDLYIPDTNLSLEVHIHDTLTTQAPTIADPFLHPLNKHPVTAVTVPLTHNDEMIGLLSGFISLDGRGVIMPLNRAAIVGQTEHAVLVDVQGQTLASTFDLPFLSPGEHAGFYQEAMAAGTPTVATVPFELNLPGEEPGHLHVMAFVPLQNAPWGLSVGGDRSGDTFTGVQQLRIGLAVIGGIALTAVWVITLLGTKRLVRPVQQLTQSAHQIAAGNLQVSLETTDGGEIGVMASALDDMRNQLLQNITQLSQWNETLESRVEKQTEHLREQKQLTQELLQQVITAQEGERRRIAYELHDEIGQMLTAVQMSLLQLSNGINTDDETLKKRLQRSRALTERTVSDLRGIIAALRPTVLDQLGLVAALEWICDHTLTPINIQFDFEMSGMAQRLPEILETIFFRIAQEAIQNIARHSKATHVHIQLNRDDEQVVMKIIDNGQGIELEMINESREAGHGLGLEGMRERAALAGGTVTINSTSGQGTAVSVIIPLTSLTQEGTPDATSSH